MTESREWLLLNAVECWLHHYTNVGKFTDQYIELRDEFRLKVQQTDEAEDLKDAPIETPPKRTTRKRTST